MPIEFRCSQCGKLLRTPDDTAGRQAQCPECGVLTAIPRQVPPASLWGESYYSPGPGASTTGGGTGGTTAAEYLPGQVDEAMIVQRVSGPATALMVTAILGMILQVLGTVVQVFQMLDGAGVKVQPNEAVPLMIGNSIALSMGVFGLVMSGLILVGALKMKKLESHSLAMTAAIIAMIPCVSPCCLLGLPFGIWALVVLGDSSVKAAFRS